MALSTLTVSAREVRIGDRLPHVRGGVYHVLDVRDSEGTVTIVTSLRGHLFTSTLPCDLALDVRRELVSLVKRPAVAHDLI